jgi:predicted ATPase/DNA-binding winged helix-turn-helix (wHTH) protein
MSDVASTVLTFGPFRLFVRERRLERDGCAVRLGSRAFEILVALAEHVGEVLSKQDLTAYVWPDTVVEEGALRVHMAGLRKTLGNGEGNGRFIMTVPGRGYCFVAHVSRTGRPPSAMPCGRIAERGSHSLPFALARIVGREDAIRRTSSEVMEGRFVSIVGPGGMGKTTVAVAVAHALLAAFGDDVCFVDLASLTDARQVAASIASAVGLSLQSDDATSCLVGFLRSRRALLVLDNCEHLMKEVASLAERILVDTLDIHILVTSREALRVEGERVSRMLPLDSPPADARLTLAEALTFPAVQLFVERATASGARLRLTDSDASVIAKICRELDGIALAIELAAGRVDAYGIRGTASLLENRFRLLCQGRRTAPARHQTLRSMLDWSYNLLNDLERLILRRTSIFVGLFSEDGVAAVAGGAEVDGDHAVDILGSLVAKSLISLDVDDAAVRYRFLATTRAYAQGKLDEANERDATARRHAAYLSGVLDQESHVGERQGSWRRLSACPSGAL